MSLTDFLADGPSTTSWADDEVVLPSAPMAVTGETGMERGAGGRRDYGSQYGREPRAPVEFPTEPPYTAYVGNLPFNADDAMIRTVFPADVVSIRLIRNPENDKPKGFGYVKFETLDALKSAVAQDGTAELGGRQLRINVSEQRPEHKEGPSNWRRTDSMPPSDSASPVASRTNSGFGRGGAREPREPRESLADSISDWRAFRPDPPAHAPPRERREPREPRESKEYREPREPRESLADTISDWRAYRPEPSAAPAGTPPRRSGAGAFGSERPPRPAANDTAAAAADDAANWRRDQPLESTGREYQPPRAPREPREPREPRAGPRNSGERGERGERSDRGDAPWRVAKPAAPVEEGKDEEWSQVQKSSSGRRSETQSPRSSERRTGGPGFFKRDANKTTADESGSWRR
ncbi:Eukaryotic translation initiation factor 4B [Coemansia sp. RSA 485]|nr:Eukaryotic translation initiation factor 4B [Coemansia sp. RSA 485]